MSTMSSSQSINGLTSKTVSVVFPVTGCSGRAVASVRARVAERGDRAEILMLTLQTTDGRQISVNDGVGVVCRLESKLILSCYAMCARQ